MADQNQVKILRASFRSEALELLSELETVLIDLEQHPEESELTNRAFRALHSIKGSGSMFGFDAMSEFVHEIESVFDRVRKGQIEVTRTLIDSTLEARDVLLDMVNSEDPSVDTDPERTSGIRSRFQEILAVVQDDGPAEESDQSSASPSDDRANSPADAAASAAAAPAADLLKYRIRFTPPADLLKRGTDPVLLIDQLRQLGQCSATANTGNVPALEQLAPDECHVSWEIDLATDQGIEAIRDVFMFVDENGAVEIDGGEQAAAPPSRTVADREPAREATSGRRTRTGDPTDTIRVPSARLDSLVDLVGELVTVQARLSDSVAGNSDPILQTVSESVERLTNELRDTAMNLRMVPIGATFSKLRRLVRDLSNQLGKEVTLETVGDETELDKTVIERLGDPLIHLIRNCVDHGLESPAARSAAGKPVSGTIRLRAAHDGGTVVVEISDDGAGLNLQRIRQIAEQRGVVTKEAGLTEHEITNLIFEPGFSTAAEVTEVSGRGVGMDVVRRTIDSLGGSIETTSTPGEGTTVALRLPLTLAIIDGILVKVRDEHYVLPLSAVNELIEVSRRTLDERPNRRLVELRGSLLPYIDLGPLFDLSGEPAEIGQIVVVHWDGVKVGLLVDQVLGQQQTVIKRLGSLPQRVDGISGATILGDGSVALILDVTRLIKIATDTERQRHREAV